MYVEIDPNSLDYDSIFLQMAQQGGHGIATFQGMRFQRGAGQTGQGLGNILRSLWHFIAPITKSVARTVGKEALSAGAEVARDVLGGQDLGDSLKQRGKASASNLLEKAQSTLQQSGMGKKKKAKKDKDPVCGVRGTPQKRKTSVTTSSGPIKKGRFSKTVAADALGLLNYGR
jgi:hypothetical protein